MDPLFTFFPEYVDWALEDGLDSTLAHMNAIGLADVLLWLF